MNYLLFFHILAVLWFIGGVVSTNVLMMRASRSKDTAFIRITVDYAVFFESFFTLPGAIIASATGVILAWRQGYGLLGTGWVVASWAVFAGAFVVAVGYMLPTSQHRHHCPDSIYGFQTLLNNPRLRSW